MLMTRFFRPFAYSVWLSSKAGRTPLLPLYALLLVRAPDVLTARTLYEFDAFGDAARTPI